MSHRTFLSACIIGIAIVGCTGASDLRTSTENVEGAPRGTGKKSDGGTKVAGEVTQPAGPRAPVSDPPTDAGTPPPPPPGDASVPGTCRSEPGANACRQCLDAQCCTEMTACAPNTPCFRFFQCIDACAVGDTNCENGCVTSNPEGVRAADAVEACGGNRCAAQCN